MKEIPLGFIVGSLIMILFLFGLVKAFLKTREQTDFDIWKEQDKAKYPELYDEDD